MFTIVNLQRSMLWYQVLISKFKIHSWLRYAWFIWFWY